MNNNTNYADHREHEPLFGSFDWESIFFSDKSKLGGWRDWLGIIALVLLLLLIFLPITLRTVSTHKDYIWHLQLAFDLAANTVTQEMPPHLLYQGLLIGVDRVASLGIPLSAVVVGVVFEVFLGLVIFSLTRPLFVSWPRLQGTGFAIAITVALMLATPITLLTFLDRNLYLGYIGIRTYHNPTIIILKPLALLLALFAVYAFVKHRAATKVLLITFTLGLASTFAKPSFAVCILPALVLITAHKIYRKEYINWVQLIVGLFVSIGAIIAYQFAVQVGSGSGGFGIAPFQVMDFLSPGLFGLLLKFFLSILFPLCVYVLYFQQARKQFLLNFVWLMFLFGAVYTYFAIEPGKWEHGNFLWSGQVTLLILFVISTLYFARETLQSRPIFTRNFSICAIVFSLHLVSGVIWYAAQLIYRQNAWF